MPLATFLASFCGFLDVDLLLHLLDQRDDVTHAEDAPGHALGVEGLERVEFLAHADQHDGLAGDLAHRQRRAAARVAVRLGEDDAGEVERRAEGARGIDRVLARHGVDDEQALVGFHGALDLLAPLP